MKQEEYIIEAKNNITFKPSFNDQHGNRVARLNFGISWCIDRDDLGVLEFSSNGFVATFYPYGKEGTVNISIYPLYSDTVKEEDSSELREPLGTAIVKIINGITIYASMNGLISIDGA